MNGCACPFSPSFVCGHRADKEQLEEGKPQRFVLFWRLRIVRCPLWLFVFRFHRNLGLRGERTHARKV